VHELTLGDSDRQRQAWGVCTAAFAIGQASAAFGLSFIFAEVGGGYQLLYALGATALGAALAIDLGAAWLATRQRPAMSG
jgi:hypothetical protein